MITQYPGAREVRVRALTRRGHSAWATGKGWTKQVPNEHDGGDGRTASGAQSALRCGIAEGSIVHQGGPNRVIVIIDTVTAFTRF